MPLAKTSQRKRFCWRRKKAALLSLRRGMGEARNWSSGNNITMTMLHTAPSSCVTNDKYEPVGVNL